MQSKSTADITRVFDNLPLPVMASAQQQHSLTEDNTAIEYTEIAKLDNHDTTQEPPSLSKNALKRARKAAFLQGKKLERRAREKEARKERKRKRAERVAAGEEISDDERLQKIARSADGPKKPFSARVVVDLGFDDKMSEKVRSYNLVLHCDVLYGEVIGNKLARLSARIHIQCQPTLIYSIWHFAIYILEWKNKRTSGQPE